MYQSSLPEYSPDYHPSSALGTKAEPREGDKISGAFVPFFAKVRGLVEFVPITRFCESGLLENEPTILRGRTPRTRGRTGHRPPPSRGKIERAARCLTVKVSAESAGAVASTMFFQSLTTRQSRRLAQPDGGAGTPSSGRGCHLQGRSAPPSWTPLHEYRGLTHALTDIAPTDTSPSPQRW